MKNPNILQHTRRPLVAILAAGALVTNVAGCRLFGGGEQSPTEPPATGQPHDAPSPPPEPQPSTNQGQSGRTARDCQLKVQKVDGNSPTYTFLVEGRNLTADYPYSNALLVDFDDGSATYESSDFGVPLTKTVEHEFPVVSQPRTFNVTSSVRIDGTVTPCLTPAVEVVPPAA
jgi:hypothetical protein